MVYRAVIIHARRHLPPSLYAFFPASSINNRHHHAQRRRRRRRLPPAPPFAPSSSTAITTRKNYASNIGMTFLNRACTAGQAPSLRCGSPSVVIGTKHKRGGMLPWNVTHRRRPLFVGRSQLHGNSVSSKPLLLK